MGSIIVIALLAFVAMKAHNLLVDFGFTQARKQAELGRKVQAAGVMAVTIFAIIIYQNGNKNNSTSSTSFDFPPPTPSVALPSSTAPSSAPPSTNVRRAEPVIYTEAPPGQYLGIGLTLAKSDTGIGIKVAAVTPESPAHLAGIKVGALVKSVGGKLVAFSDPNECAKLIQDSSSPVIIEITQPGELSRTSFSIYKVPLPDPR